MRTNKIFIIIAVGIIIGSSYFAHKKFNRVNFLKTLDGEIVYVDRDGDILNIYKISANGKNKKLLYHNEDKINSNSMFPQWSKNGVEIYFTAMKDGEWKTFVINSDGKQVSISGEPGNTLSNLSREVDITTSKGNLYYKEGDKQIQVYSFSNYDSKMNTGASEASWSPDKKYIIFQSCGLIGGCNIFIADKDGKTAKLTSGMQPDWK